MPANYVLLEKITVGATAISTVTFSGIPQTGYTDLVVKMSTRRDSGANDGIGIRFNGSSAGNYSMRNLSGDGSSAASSNAASVSAIYGYGTNNWATATASTFSNAEFYIPNYTSSNAKSISLDGVIENNATGSFMALTAGLWSLTSAITSIDILPLSGGSFVQYSTFYLYGVAKLGTTPAIVPYATGGDTIMTDGTYWYHTFLSSGTFTPAKSLTCDYLVVAGGGGGGSGNTCGGGGAGGFRTSIGGSPLSLATSAVTVTVGAGGAGGASLNSAGTNGSNSVFSTITSTGGGGGGNTGAVGLNGGSGGGGGGGSGADKAGGTATSGQGSNGGNGSSTPNYGSGGGGGANAVGGNGSSSISGNGGAGLASSITGSSVTYAGGGGGGASEQGATRGTGGSGGGGDGSVATGQAVAGTANTGSGGGGGGGDAVVGGKAGGSGIVIVRYAV
jgi:hypothetical protein